MSSQTEKKTSREFALMVSLVDLLLAMFMAAGAGLGGSLGHHTFGLIGGFAGIAVGLILGWLLWRLLFMTVSRRRDPRSTQELHAMVRAGYWQIAHSVLTELSSRGEDISEGFPIVRTMLLSDNAYVRGTGYLILQQVYPETVSLLGEYDPREPSEESRTRIQALPGPDSKGPAN